MVDIRIEAKAGFDALMENNNFIILNTHLTKDLINEGIAREIISKVQSLRKMANLELTDRISINYRASKKIEEALKAFEETIKQETLATSIQESTSDGEEFLIDSEKIYIDIKKN